MSINPPTLIARAAAIALACSLVAACGKKKETPAAAEPAPAPATATAPAPAPAPVATATPAAEPTAADLQKAVKQGKMDFATMEDKYLNDTRGQWATSAKATSTFGDDGGKTPSQSNAANNATGAVDGKTWTNNHQDIGFDSLELRYGKPVHATDVRVVMPSDEGVETISKVELEDSDGKWTTAWTGISDVTADKRGPRTWFVRSFDKTTATIQGVRVTFANNVHAGYKVVDAVQLVGD